MPRNSKEFKVNDQPNCPPNKKEALCGFKEGMRALIFDKNGAWDAFTLTQIQDPALHLQHSGDLSTDYDDGSQITQVATHTYYLKTDIATNTYQLMHYDGYMTDLPVVRQRREAGIPVLRRSPAADADSGEVVDRPGRPVDHLWSEAASARGRQRLRLVAGR